ncbi:FAD-binding oxidoreductase [Ahrensia kielensis]|uniref:FAD-binding oxidoreductase n=1 Tax=Ahrensia kielensis TaxID=76980 RepID=A0ABU9TAL7_9HYPH
MLADSSNENTVLWSLTAPPAPTVEIISENLSFDVVIVGAGLTGLRAAVSLAEAGTSVAVIDAQRIGYGSSGRSGGQCNPIWRATPDDLATEFGNTQAERLIQATLTSADDLFDDIRRLNIDCGAEQNGWFQAAHTRRQAASLKKLASAWRKVGAEIEDVGSTGTQAGVGSPAYEFSLLHAKGGFVQPLALTRGYAGAALANGARLFEQAPATAMERKNGKWHVVTPGGILTAEQVILATNAYTDTLWPGLRQTILPMVSISLATEPLNAEQQASVLPGRVTVSDSRLAIYFARYDSDNRLVFGCVGSTDSVKTFGGPGRLRKGLRTVFPQIADIGIECSWAGRIGVTPTMKPHLHEPAKGVLAGLGFSGRGIAMTSVMGRALARKVLGASNSDMPFPVTAIKPMALHGVSKAFVPLMAPTLSTLDQASVVLDRGLGRLSKEKDRT